jgi:hypothetical protein
MATLERRVQVLFDPAQYAELEAEAAASHQSVGALIREAVEERLDRRRTNARDAMERLFALADRLPPGPPIDWQQEKELIAERSYLRDLP